ncbi:hypothetical protein SAY86_017028 [Trapa natans]|uniref:C3H1-type domain-containing protein n=1 Tax=Trapa natans TaxID=22666 RepID=A0AAN7R2C4_TRANT|nr:hypothetical protein SAY86_017028 [Trapa natans]
MEFAGGHKRWRTDSSLNGNDAHKKYKQEGESFPSGLGSKSKPCTKFFSTSGCPFGEGCHFLHYVPGGVKAVSQMLGNPSLLSPAPRNLALPSSFPDAPPAVKLRLCNKYGTAEGCKFGDKCHFAHGEWELGKPSAPSYEDPRAMSRVGMGRYDLPPKEAAGFGASATAKISINGSLAGAIIGKNGVNSKQICRLTGVKLSIRDHESDPSLRNIELEGSFEQIQQASAMVRDLIDNAGSSGPAGRNKPMPHHSSRTNFKTKLCDNFTKGTCTFGDRCHFAHGADELQKSGP